MAFLDNFQIENILEPTIHTKCFQYKVASKLTDFAKHVSNLRLHLWLTVKGVSMSAKLPRICQNNQNFNF